MISSFFSLQLALLNGCANELKFFEVIASDKIGYLLTDIVGSTRKWEIVPSQMHNAKYRHDEIIKSTIASFSGEIANSTGDGFLAFFKSVNPLPCAIKLLELFKSENWNSVGGLSIRIAIHGGQIGRNVPWVQSDINRVSRMAGVGHGNQIVASEFARMNFDLPEGVDWFELGQFSFKGIRQNIELFCLSKNLQEFLSFPPPKRSRNVKETLPKPFSPFFGRGDDIDRISNILDQEDARFITISGVGGVGKTRMAIELAKQKFSKKFVVFVSCLGIRSARQLVLEIAKSANFPFFGGIPEIEQLIEFFKDKEGILILDNVDELIHEYNVLLKLSSSCNEFKIVATSRESFGAKGEQVYRLSGFNSFDIENSPVTQSPEFKIFNFFALQVNSDFSHEKSREASFIEICKIVGGVPIAFELLAQWTASLSIGEILQELVQGNLIGKAPASQNGERGTIEAIIEGSWNNLGEQGKKILKTLSVFQSDFDLEAIYHLCDCALDDVDELVRKSLLEFSTERRFSLHPLVKKYSNKRVSDRRKESVIALHQEYYFQKFCYLSDQFILKSQSQVVKSLRSELNNLESAWHNANKSQNIGAIRKVSSDVFYFYCLTSMFEQGLSFFDQAKSGVQELDAIKANLMIFSGRVAEAKEIIETLNNFEQISDEAKAHMLQAFGSCAQLEGQFDQAIRHLQQAKTISTKLRNNMGQYYASLSLVSCFLKLGDTMAAKKELKSGFSICKQGHNTHGIMNIHILAGDIARMEDRLDSAQQNFKTALDFESDLIAPQFRTAILTRLKAIAVLNSDSEAAIKFMEEAKSSAMMVGEHKALAQTNIELGECYLEVGNLRKAQQLIEDGLFYANLVGASPQIESGLINLSKCLHLVGQKKLATRIDKFLELESHSSVRIQQFVEKVIEDREYRTLHLND